MGLLTQIKEKVSNNKENGKKSYDEQLRQLDDLIEDLFKMDENAANEKAQERE